MKNLPLYCFGESFDPRRVVQTRRATEPHFYGNRKSCIFFLFLPPSSFRTHAHKDECLSSRVLRTDSSRLISKRKAVVKICKTEFFRPFRLKVTKKVDTCKIIGTAGCFSIAIERYWRIEVMGILQNVQWIEFDADPSAGLGGSGVTAPRL